MAKNAEDRYQSAWGIKADLERCAQQLAEIGRIDSIPLCLQDVSEQFVSPEAVRTRGRRLQHYWRHLKSSGNGFCSG